MSDNFDLIIVGAGMIGSALAVFLRETHLKVALIEAHKFNVSTESSFDDRNLVLSQASKKIFQSQDLWSNFQSDITPIKQIHISEQQRFGSVVLQAHDLNMEALAYSLKAKDLGALLHNELQSENITLLCPAKVLEIKQEAQQASVELEHEGQQISLSARLLILADGTHSRFRETLEFDVKEKSYEQHAIVTNVVTELPHNNTAYERFSCHGPLALLPRPTANELGMVFCVSSNDVEYYLNLAEKPFLSAITKRFGRRLGRFIKIGARKAYPLQLFVVEQQYQGRVLLLGNSAHSIHPNAAQGFNLGLRDVATLVETIKSAIQQQHDIGSQALLEKYQMSRLDDQKNVIRFTDGLARLFYNRDPIKWPFKRLAMLSVEHVPMLKKTLMLRAMGLYGEQANKMKEIA